MPLQSVLFKLDYISLVNLILQKEVVKELIQEDCTLEMINSTLTSLGDKKVRAEIKGNYEVLTKMLGGKNASQEVAQAIINDLQ